MEYLGAVDGHELLFLKEIHHGGTLRTSEIVSFKRDGDSLVVKRMDSPMQNYITEAYIKNNVLYFTEFSNNQYLWNAILDGAHWKLDDYFKADLSHMKDKLMIWIGAEGPNDIYGTGFFHLNKIIIDPENSNNFLAPAEPDKIELNNESKEKLLKDRPVDVYDDGSCASAPYFETYAEYVDKDKVILTSKDFEGFVKSVKDKCDELKIHLKK